MLIPFLLSCATTDKGDTGLLWLEENLTCPLEDTSFTSLSAPLTCEAQTNLSSFTVLERFTIDNEFMSMPIVGQLTDDNGDGLISPQDIPDFLLTKVSDGQTNLSLISSDDMTTHWSGNDTDFNGVIYTPHSDTQLAVGVGELDGELGIFSSVFQNGKSDTCYLARWSIEGNLDWVHTQNTIDCGRSFPALSDMDGNGQAEVLIDGLLLDANAGLFIERIGASGAGYGFSMDLDNDGYSEWLDGTALRMMDGTLICETGESEGMPTAADLDNDGDGEWVINTEGLTRWFHHDCTVGQSWTHSNGLSQPVIADFDGDGSVEIAIQTQTEIVVYESDGSTLWAQPWETEVGLQGMSATDMDGDNIAELLAVVNNDLIILDGKTGSSRLEYALDGQPTSLPLALQLDGSGPPEIVLSLRQGLWVLSVDNGSIDTNTASNWHQRSYAIGQQIMGWQIPMNNMANFAQQNSMNSTAVDSLSFQYADIQPTLVETCTDDCQMGVVTFTVAVDNTGASSVPEGVSVGVYDISGNLLHRYQTEDELLANQSAQLGIRVLSEEIPPSGLILRVDDEENIVECNESDNQITINTNPCTQ